MRARRGLVPDEHGSAHRALALERRDGLGRALGLGAARAHEAAEAPLRPARDDLRPHAAPVVIVPVLHAAATRSVGVGARAEVARLGELAERRGVVGLPGLPLVVPGAGLLLPRGAGARVRQGVHIDPAVVYTQRPAGHGVEEGAVVRDDQREAAEGPERGGDAGPRLAIEVVRRLVDEEHVGLAVERRGELPPAPLPGGERAPAIERRGIEAEPITERDRLAAGGRRERAHVVAEGLHGLRTQHHERARGLPPDGAPIGRELAGREPQEGRLAGAVLARDADHAAIELQGGVLEDRARAAERERDSTKYKSRHEVLRRGAGTIAGRRTGAIAGRRAPAGLAKGGPGKVADLGGWGAQRGRSMVSRLGAATAPANTAGRECKLDLSSKSDHAGTAATRSWRDVEGRTCSEIALGHGLSSPKQAEFDARTCRDIDVWT